MILTSRFSEPAAYVASILVHTPGIVLLFQYLFMRNVCSQCRGPHNRNQIDVPNQEANPPATSLGRTMSDYSTASEDFKRKQRRFTTYGDGGEYTTQLRRQSLPATWESMQSVEGPRMDRTASGRRIPVRMSLESSAASVGEGSSPSLRRSRSSGGDRRPLIREDSVRSAMKAPMTEISEGHQETFDSSQRPKSADSTKRKRLTKNPPAELISSNQEKQRDVPSLNPIPMRMSSIHDPPSPTVTLRPVLLPPLHDPLRPRTAPEERPEQADI